jgi:glyceraldehyde 3-phosphate dehydrogenase
LVVLNLEVSKETSIDEINAIMKNIEGELVEQIKYSTNNELVSSDIVGTSAPSIYDSNATIVSNDARISFCTSGMITNTVIAIR